MALARSILATNQALGTSPNHLRGILIAGLRRCRWVDDFSVKRDGTGLWLVHLIASRYPLGPYRFRGTTIDVDKGRLVDSQGNELPRPNPRKRASNVLEDMRQALLIKHRPNFNGRNLSSGQSRPLPDNRARPGHARNHKPPGMRDVDFWDEVAEIINNPTYVATGRNEGGNLVTAFWKDGAVVFTEPYSLSRVITVYGSGFWDSRKRRSSNAVDFFTDVLKPKGSMKQVIL